MNHFLAIWAALIVFGVLRLSGTAQRVVLGRFSRHLLVQLVQITFTGEQARCLHGQ
jgi:hypothetical protein